MGMAASQARFLALTARKSNTEYQGQQVNQQRTTLSNQSASLYNQMMSLDVPTPPSVEDYYNKTYSFTNTADSSDNTVYNITSFSKVKNTVDIEYDKTVSAMQYANTMVSYDGTSKAFKVGGVNAEVKPIVYSTVKNDKILKEAVENAAGDSWNVEGLQDTDIAMYSVSIAGDTKPYYITKEQYTAITENAGTPTQLWKNGETVVSGKDTLSVDKFEFNKDSGRLEKIHVIGANNSSIPTNQTFSLQFTKVKDDEAYEQAMLDYKYKQAEYEKEYEKINAETAKIQAKDKNLELKLKQLDTEQNAIQTEMEAVTKVLDKNIEDTFKTFA